MKDVEVEVEVENDLGTRLLPRPKNWDEVWQITGRLSDVPIHEVEKGHIATPYDLPPTGMCGRRGCETRHGRGAIIALPGKRYVNIGHCCVATYIPDVMKRMWDTYHDEVDRKTQAEILARSTSEANEKLVWTDLVEAEAQRLTSLRGSFLQQVPGELAAEILKRAEKNEAHVERPCFRIKRSSGSRACDAAGRTRRQGCGEHSRRQVRTHPDR